MKARPRGVLGGVAVVGADVADGARDFDGAGVGGLVVGKTTASAASARGDARPARR